MKKGLIMGLCLLILVAFSGMAMADNTIDIDQIGFSIGPTGYINWVDVDQSGYNQWIDVDQVAGSYNKADVDQGGVHGNQIGVNQSATTYNLATVEQYAGLQSSVGITQTAADGENEVEVYQWYGNGGRKWATIYQDAGTYNYAYVMQDSGKQTEITIHQTAITGYNYAYTEQYGSSMDTTVRVYQDAGNYNQLNVYQDLSNARWSLTSLDQDAMLGYNRANIDNRGGYTRLENAAADGSSAGYGTYAKQTSSGGDNELDWYTIGHLNTFALHQEAVGNNIADVEQYGGGNFLGVYQVSSGGSNTLTARQTGNMSATVVQITSSGNSAINITQN